MNKPIATQIHELQVDYDRTKTEINNAINELVRRLNYNRVVLDALVEIIGQTNIQKVINDQAMKMLENTENIALSAFNDKVLDKSFVKADIVSDDSFIVCRYADKAGAIPISIQQRGFDIPTLSGRKVGDKFSLRSVLKSTEDNKHLDTSDVLEVIAIFDSVQLKESA